MFSFLAMNLYVLPISFLVTFDISDISSNVIGRFDCLQAVLKQKQHIQYFFHLLIYYQVLFCISQMKISLYFLVILISMNICQFQIMRMPSFFPLIWNLLFFSIISLNDTPVSDFVEKYYYSNLW